MNNSTVETSSLSASPSSSIGSSGLRLASLWAASSAYRINSINRCRCAGGVDDFSPRSSASNKPSNARPSNLAVCRASLRSIVSSSTWPSVGARGPAYVAPVSRTYPSNADLPATSTGLPFTSTGERRFQRRGDIRMLLAGIASPGLRLAEAEIASQTGHLKSRSRNCPSHAAFKSSLPHLRQVQLTPGSASPTNALSPLE